MRVIRTLVSFAPVEIILESPEEVALFQRIANRNRTVALALDDESPEQQVLRDKATNGIGMSPENEAMAKLLGNLSAV